MVTDELLSHRENVWKVFVAVKQATSFCLHFNLLNLFIVTKTFIAFTFFVLNKNKRFVLSQKKKSEYKETEFYFWHTKSIRINQICNLECTLNSVSFSKFGFGPDSCFIMIIFHIGIKLTLSIKHRIFTLKSVL